MSAIIVGLVVIAVAAFLVQLFCFGNHKEQ